MNKVIDDVYSLLKHEPNSLTQKDLEKLSKIVELVITDAVIESKLAEKDITELDFGFGKLYIKCDEDVKVKFVLTDSFKSRLDACNKADTETLDAKLNEALVTRITHIYKDLIL